MRGASRERVGSFAVAVAVVVLLGCTGPDGGVGRGRGRAGNDEVGGSVVSTVNGHAIRLAQVQALAYDTGLTLRESLSRLQAELLLRQEAARRGTFDARAETVDVAQRAAVQALLGDEAAEVTVSDDEVQKAYEAQRARFETREERRAIHLLAAVREDVPADVDARARAYVSAALPELKAATDLDAFAKAHTGRAVDGVPIGVEKLPPLARVGRVAKPFEDAMFSLPEPGVVPTPVRTSYGWHAIRVVEITPATGVPYETAAATLRQELRLERQTAHVAALIQALRRSNPVVIAPDTDRVLAELPL